MKTNQVMVRRMGQFNVLQRTKDGMFNATELLKQWNKKEGSIKKIAHFWSLEQTKQFMEVLESEVSRDSTHAETRVKTNADGSKIAGETWMHPILFIKFAMWINPRFEYYVIKFVYDQLIEYRHSAGDNYRRLTSALQRLEKVTKVNYARVGRGLNHIVFGYHAENLRQTATPDELRRLTDVQNQLAFAIDMNYIRTFDGLINEMIRIYNYTRPGYQRAIKN
jgi:hypothetical protein